MEKLLTGKPRLYLAGPDVFRADALEHAEELKGVCEEHGLVGVSPSDVTLRRQEGQTGRDFAARVRRSNIALLHSCDGILANVTPFRGPNVDDGTAWEMGYAVGQGKPAFPYVVSGQGSSTYLRKCSSLLSLDHDGTACRDRQKMAVEDFDLPANLMLFDERFGFFRSFRTAVKAARDFFKKKRKSL